MQFLTTWCKKQEAAIAAGKPVDPAYLKQREMEEKRIEEARQAHKEMLRKRFAENLAKSRRKE